MDPRLASTPFLFLTGLAAEHQARAAMSLGADDYLTKPVSNGGGWPAHSAGR